MPQTNISRRERLLRIQDLLITRLEEAMNALLQQTAPEDAPPHPVRMMLMREAAARFAFWSICGRQACSRARRCRRAPGECFAACGPMVPPEVRESVIAKLRSSFSLSPRGRG
jgi:hypothetical protein